MSHTARRETQSSTSSSTSFAHWQTRGAAFLLVLAAAVACGGALITDDRHGWVNVMYGVITAATAGWLLTGKLAAHVFARGLSWGLLSVFLLGTYFSNSTEQAITATLATLFAIALFVLGRAGLSASSTSNFAPTAFRASLLVGTVCSIFLCVWFSLMNIVALDDMAFAKEDLIACAIFGGGMVALLASTVGILRLQLWALLVKTCIDTLIVGAVILAVVVDMPAEISIVVGTFAFFNFALDVNVLIACVRGTKYRPPSLARFTWWMAPLAAFVAGGSAIAMYVFDLRFID